jgi:predicted transcriptional regulator
MRILAMLDEEPASPAVLGPKLGVPVSRVAYHVRVLHELGLIELVSTRQRRGAVEHFYRTRQHPRFTDEAWDNLDIVSKQRVLTSILESSHEYAMRSAAAGGFDEPDAHFTTTRMKLDEEGWQQIASLSKQWLEEVAAVEADAAARIAEDPHSAVDAGLVIQFFKAVPFSSPAADQPADTSHKRSRRRAAKAS